MSITQIAATLANVLAAGALGTVALGRFGGAAGLAAAVWATYQMEEGSSDPHVAVKILTAPGELLLRFAPVDDDA
jgi:hypothetical protein